jgi:hypothetical protein
MRQQHLPGLDPGDDEALLRAAWARVPRVREADFARAMTIPVVARCLRRVAETMTRQGGTDGRSTRTTRR